MKDYSDIRRALLATSETPASDDMNHLYPHQQQFANDWSQGHHQHQNHHVAQHVQVHAQAQAQAQVAAAAAAAQQQHYSRITGNNGTAIPGVGGIPRGPSTDMTAQITQIGLESGMGMTEDNRRVLDWIAQLLKASTRETALLELSKKREQVPELALILWHSFGPPVYSQLGRPEADDKNVGVMTSLLQEIISVYPLLNPSQLTAAASNRVCNALALLQCVASHTETRGLFLSGMYLRRIPCIPDND